MQERFNIQKSINVIFHINKGENSIDAEKTLDKIE